MAKVIRQFRETFHDNHIYNEGDTYPAKGFDANWNVSLFYPMSIQLTVSPFWKKSQNLRKQNRKRKKSR